MKKIQKPFSEKRHILFEKIKTLSLKQIQELIKKIFLNKNDNKNLNYEIFFKKIQIKKIQRFKFISC